MLEIQNLKGGVATVGTLWGPGPGPGWPWALWSQNSASNFGAETFRIKCRIYRAASSGTRPFGFARWYFKIEVDVRVFRTWEASREHEET